MDRVANVSNVQEKHVSSSVGVKKKHVHKIDTNTGVSAGMIQDEKIQAKANETTPPPTATATT